MDFWIWLEGAIGAILLGLTLGGIVVYVLEKIDDKHRRKESDAKSLAFQRKYYEERMDGEIHLISLGRKEGKEKHWLLLDSLSRVRGDACDFFSEEELREKVATMACPFRTLEEYDRLFRRECRYDGQIGEERYICTSLDGGNSWFYINDDGAYMGTLEELPEFKMKQRCIEKLCARAVKREKRAKSKRFLGMLGIGGGEEDEPALSGEDLQALGMLGFEVTVKKN